jgi:hypothetical protein
MVSICRLVPLITFQQPWQAAAGRFPDHLAIKLSWKKVEKDHVVAAVYIS